MFVQRQYDSIFHGLRSRGLPLPPSTRHRISRSEAGESPHRHNRIYQAGMQRRELFTPYPQGVTSTFSWGAKICIFQCHRITEKFEKQHFICSNFTLFIVPFLSFFLFFFFFFFFLGGRCPQPPSNDAPAYPMLKTSTNV